MNFSLGIFGKRALSYCNEIGQGTINKVSLDLPSESSSGCSLVLYQTEKNHWAMLQKSLIFVIQYLFESSTVGFWGFKLLSRASVALDRRTIVICAIDAFLG